MDNIKLDNFDEYLIEYFDKWKNTHYSDIGLCELIMKMFHVIIVLYILLGIFLPHKIVPFYILCLLLLLISWKVFGGCLITLIFNKTSFVPISNGKKEQIIYILLLISILNYTYPQYSLFNIIYSVMDKLNKDYN